MPSYVCSHPTCQSYLPQKGYCKDHVEQGKLVQPSSNHYDKYRRDPATKAFYNSKQWAKARHKRLTESPVCQECNEVFAEHVHHIKPLKEYPKLSLEHSNLMAVCPPCHNAIERRRGS